jgi:hypothetical protein
MAMDSFGELSFDLDQFDIVQSFELIPQDVIQSDFNQVIPQDVIQSDFNQLDLVQDVNQSDFNQLDLVQDVIQSDFNQLDLVQDVNQANQSNNRNKNLFTDYQINYMKHWITNISKYIKKETKIMIAQHIGLTPEQGN